MISTLLLLKPWAAVIAFGWLALAGLGRWRGAWQVITFLLVAGETIGIIMMGDYGPVTLARMTPPLAWGAAALAGMALLRKFLMVRDDIL